MARRGALIGATLAVLMLGACGGGDTPSLMNIRSTTNGPDEFAIVPPKPLAMPETLADLPEPTLGGANRADPTPNDDAIVALGGQPQAGRPISAADAALVGYAGRNGVSTDIRQALATEDLEYRRRNRGKPLQRLFNINTYYSAYDRQQLDQHDELARWRRVGARTVSAPPEGIER